MELDVELDGAVDLDVMEFAGRNHLHVSRTNRAAFRLVVERRLRGVLEDEVELARDHDETSPHTLADAMRSEQSSRYRAFIEDRGAPHELQPGR